MVTLVSCLMSLVAGLPPSALVIGSSSFVHLRRSRRQPQPLDPRSGPFSDGRSWGISGKTAAVARPASEARVLGDSVMKSLFLRLALVAAVGLVVQAASAQTLAT